MFLLIASGSKDAESHRYHKLQVAGVIPRDFRLHAQKKSNSSGSNGICFNGNAICDEDCMLIPIRPPYIPYINPAYPLYIPPLQ